MEGHILTRYLCWWQPQMICKSHVLLLLQEEAWARPSNAIEQSAACEKPCANKFIKSAQAGMCC